MIDESKLEEVAGGRSYNEQWVCPECGYVLYLTHYNANFKIREHLDKHGWGPYGSSK